MINKTKLFITTILLFCAIYSNAQRPTIVLQTDFGLKDGAVAAIKGVIVMYGPEAEVYDLTHEIPAYSIWDAAYRLVQTAPYWPQGTVFVSVVDPGVGTERLPIVLLTETGQYFISPDNGTLTLVAGKFGIREVRKIDTEVNRLPGSTRSNTFHGRDIFAYTAALLATKKITFEQVGPKVEQPIKQLPYIQPVLTENSITGTITVLDPEYGNVWTDISAENLDQFKFVPGEKYLITISSRQKTKFKKEVLFGTTFGEVPKGTAICYLNSMLNLALAINQGSFVSKYGISYGADWNFRIERIPKP